MVTRPPKGQCSLQTALHQAFRQSDGSYDSRRLTAYLAQPGFSVGRDKVRRLMKQSALKARCPQPKVWRKHAVGFADNIANTVCPIAPNSLWSGDITYIATKSGWLYLAVVMDWFSRQVVGWSCSTEPNAALCEQALRFAVHRRKPEKGVIFHSDRGVQYRSKLFQTCLQEFEMSHSQSRAGKCTDNAITERFFRSLKSEKLSQYRFETPEQALLCVAEYIEDFYNPKRLHSALGYQSPMQFEAKLV